MGAAVNAALLALVAMMALFFASVIGRGIEQAALDAVRFEVEAAQ